jgi:hypothetical protein
MAAAECAVGQAQQRQRVDRGAARRAAIPNTSGMQRQLSGKGACRVKDSDSSTRLPPRKYPGSASATWRRTKSGGGTQSPSMNIT